MFGLPTFPKLIVIAAIIAAVWYFVRRGQVARGSADKDERPTGGRGGNAKPVEDMVQCKSCGAYYPAKSTCSCGHSAG